MDRHPQKAGAPITHPVLKTKTGGHETRHYRKNIITTQKVVRFFGNNKIDIFTCLI